jgi:cytoskeletal protein CcmA (bactofilin family)
MVFNRKTEPVSGSDATLTPQLRRGDRSSGHERQHLHAVSNVPDAQSVIGSDLSIEGQTITIRCKGALKVLGDIQADVHSKQIEVGKEARVDGAIAADTVNVFGRVSGAILGTHVVLHASADVQGDIHSHLLSIEQGAAFDGRSRRVTDPAELAPQLEKGEPAPAAMQTARHIEHAPLQPGPPPLNTAT